ncbi:hypothetical protein [Streptomyces sp. NPDC050416]|uniref:hypothetical protein n=1 Tax=Streptomyces sp. NPDC050416 TaxID=3365611 RepID=UPI003799806F
MPTEAVLHLIRQAYEAGGPYQWAREAWKNSEESGATIIQFGIEEQAAESLGVLRRTIMDNGEGMSDEDLPVFLTAFGGGGKPIGVDGNFGQGFKSSVLHWNPFGVVVISYTPQCPDGAMLWIYRDPKGNYALKEWETEDQNGEFTGMREVVVPFADEEHGCDWSKIRPDWMKTGTIIVLLGSGPHCDTWMGDQDPSRRETVDGLVRFLNSRLIEIPKRDGKSIETTVIDSYTKLARGRRETKDKTVTLPDGEARVWRPRRVHGLRHFIPDSAVRGTVTVDDHGTKVDWFYVPEPNAPVGYTADYIEQLPVVVVDYQGEAYHADRSKSRYRQFGISDEIMRRTWLIIRPPVFSDAHPTRWGVLTQASRHTLIVKGEMDLPWEQWGNAFWDQFPEELQKAQDAARAKESSPGVSLMAKNLARIFDRLNPRFKAPRIVSSTVGRVMGEPTGSFAGTPGTRSSGPSTGSGTHGGPGGTAGSRHILAPATSGRVTGASTPVRGGYPTFKWKPFDADEDKYLARYERKETVKEGGVEYRGVVYLNRRHPVFRQELSYWEGVWPKADTAKVQALVEEVYGEEAVAHVVHAQRLDGTPLTKTEEGEPQFIGGHDVEELITPTALSAALLGLVNVEQRMHTRGGHRFGPRVHA